MKYIILGLGNFGSSLGMKLTEKGNEVIGVDSVMSKVDQYKEKLSHTICMDTTDQFTMAGLPLQDADVVVVAIGETQGANILTTAILKTLNVKRLISRANSPLHETILRAMGVDEIVHPEEETAERWSKKLSIKGVLDSFELNNEFGIVELVVPERYVGKSLEEIGFRRNHNIVVLTTIRPTEEKSLIGKTKTVHKVQGVASPETRLEAGDFMVIYGNNQDIRKLFENQ
jgi:trk system potassium uptake protein